MQIPDLTIKFLKKYQDCKAKITGPKTKRHLQQICDFSI